MKKHPRDSRNRQSTLLEKRGWLFALVITAIGFLLRLPGIFEWWLNPDEGIYLSMLTWKNTARFWAEMAGNAHPPLYYVVTRVLGLLTKDFVAIRSLSLLFGSAAIYAAWLAGREIASSERARSVTGLLSALLVAVSPGAIVMSQLIRPYMMQLTFLLLALYQLLRFRRERHTSNLIWYCVLLSLALLTHYSSFLAFGVFGILILSDFITGKFGIRDIPRLIAAHVAPVLICVGLYIFHLRPHLIDSALAAEAFDGWLAPLMIHSIGDVWARLLGFMGYLLGAGLGGPAALMWLASVVLATKRRSWSLLILNLAAFGIAVVAASLGQYPFGACRHSTWLISLFVIPLAWTLAQSLTSTYRAKTIVVALIALLALAGEPVGRLVGTTRTHTRPLNEQVLKRSDMARIRPVLTGANGPGVVLMSMQCYYLLLPFYVDEREAAEPSSDGSFFLFQWASRDVIVVRSWGFSARPDDFGKPNHLYTFVKNVDRLMPQLELGKQHDVLMLFGGWSHETSQLLLRADQSLPPDTRLITSHNHVPGLTALVMDIARYRLIMREALKSRYH